MWSERQAKICHGHGLDTLQPPKTIEFQEKSGAKLLVLKTASQDPKLQAVAKVISSSMNYESFYIFGSYARGEQTAQSDLDVLLLVRLPILISSIPRLRALSALKSQKVDMNIFSTYSLRGIRKGLSSPLTPSLVNWKEQAILISGKDLLPTPNPVMNPSSFALFVCRVSRWFLGFIESGPTGITLRKGAAKWLVKQGNNMIENCRISGVPSRWGLLGQKVKEEASKPNPNLQLICGYFAEMLESIRQDIRFSLADQTLYVLTILAARRRFLWRTLLRRVPAQLRLFDSLTLLFKSASSEALDPILVSRFLKLLDDHLALVREDNAYVKWSKAQRVLLQYFEMALRLPFGTMVFNKGPEYPRIVFV